MRKRIAFFSLVCLWGCASPPPPSRPAMPVDQVCRSCQPYQIDGAWYYPQQDYQYEEEGTASWYGPGFHGRKKAYGGTEVYDQEGISAAHKTLPLPTIVKVTNLQTGKCLKVLVDDRGPYVGDRIIDLSKGAARELGLVNCGLARVKVQALPHESKAFAKHLGRYGRWGIDPSGRSWHTIYKQEIEPRFSENEPQFTELIDEAPAQATVAIEKDFDFHLDSSPLDQLVEVVHRQPAQPTPMAKASAVDAYFVEVAHFLHEKNAHETLNELRPIAKGHVRQFVADKQQRLYAVKLGPFTSKEHAKAALQNLSAIGYSQASVILS